MTSESCVLECTARDGLVSRVWNKEGLQTKHSIGDPFFTLRREGRSAKESAVVQAVTKRVAGCAALIFRFETVGIEGARVSNRRVARLRWTGRSSCCWFSSGVRTALNGLVTGAQVACWMSASGTGYMRKNRSSILRNE